MMSGNDTDNMVWKNIYGILPMLVKRGSEAEIHITTELQRPIQTVDCRLEDLICDRIKLYEKF